MRREVKAAVIFFKRLAVARGKLDLVKADLFAEKLQQVMSDKYTGHWYPECPTKGQAYRCIRINNQSPPDDMLLKACKQSDIPYSSLGLPPEITVWVDPLEVSVRSGENGRPFTIARFSPNEEQGDPIDESSNVDTSDYHSETSSDCSSIVSSDTEEDPKDGEAKDKQAKPGPAVDKEAVKGATYTIAMVPRVRTRPVDGQPKVKVVRPMVAGSLPYMPHGAPVWTPYPKPPPMFLTPVCTPLLPPPPPPPPPHPQQVYGYFVLQPQSQQFMVPQASLQPWEPPLL